MHLQDNKLQIEELLTRSTLRTLDTAELDNIFGGYVGPAFRDSGQCTAAVGLGFAIVGGVVSGATLGPFTFGFSAGAGFAGGTAVGGFLGSMFCPYFFS